MLAVLRAAAVALLCLATVACTREQMLEKFSSPEDRAFSQQIIKAIQSGDDTFILGHLHPDLARQLVGQMPKMHTVMISGPGIKITPVDARFTVSSTNGAPAARRSFLAYELDRGDQHVLVRIGLYREGTGPAQVTDLWVNQLDKPIDELTGFHLEGKTPVHYAVLALAVLSFLTILAALVVLARTKGPRPKWLWVLGSLLGFGQFAINWSTGQLGFQLINIQLLGAFAMQQGALAPWQVGFGFPVVAMLVLARAIGARGRTKTAPTPSPAMGEESDIPPAER